MSKNSAKSLTKTAVLDASDNPDDQDEARKRRVKMDFASWRKQTKAGKTTHQEEVGISSSAKMKDAQKEAELKAKEEAAVKKQKEATKKEEVQFDEVYKKLPVAKMASKISKKQFKAGQSGDVKTISKKSTETGKMIGVLDTHDPERSKAKSKIKEAKVDAGKDDEKKEDDRNKRKFGHVPYNKHGHSVLRRSLHRMRRGDKKRPGYKEVNVETGKVGKEIGEGVVTERSLDTFEKNKKEEIVKGMKKDTKGFKKRYGPDWKNVMHGAATNQAKKAGDTSKSDERYASEETKMPGVSEKDKSYIKERGKNLFKKDLKGNIPEEVELSEQWVDSAIDISTDYFFYEGLNPEGVELVMEEVGLDDFVEFVLDPIEELNEERDARKAKVSAPSYEKVKAAVDKADKAKKASGKGEYAKSYAKRSGETEDSTNYDDKAPAKKAPAKKVTVKKVTPTKKAATKKKVTASVAKAKTKQPLKPTTKKGIRGAIERGVARHKAAVGKAKKEVGKVVKTAKATAKQHSQHRKDFVKGITPTSKEKKIAKGVGKVVKKALTREELELLEKSRLDKDPPPQFEKGDDDRGNPDYMKSVSYSDEEKWKRLQRMRKASKKKEVRAKAVDESATNPKKFSMKKFARGLEKQYGKGSVISKYTEKPKPQPQKKREPKKDTRSPEQKKADQHKANMDAVYGRTPWNKEGSLGS